MTENDRSSAPTDNELVSFIDGELDADTRARVLQALADDPETLRRLAILDAAGRSVEMAFAPLLDQAPQERMQSNLDGLLSRSPGVQTVGKNLFRRPAILAVSAVILFVAGIAVDRATGLLNGRPHLESLTQAGEDWRDAVAGYFALYTDDTFAGRPPSGPRLDAAIERAGRKLGLPLSTADVTLPDVDLAGAIMFGYDDKPLAQISYVDPKNGPMALCILDAGGADEPPESERRLGFNVVYWVKDRRTFMLIGREASEKLDQYARIIRQRI